MAAINDLRDFVKAVDEIGELRRVRDVEKNEIAAITTMSGAMKPIPAILFDQIKGYKPNYGVLVNPLASMKRCSLIHGISDKLEGSKLVEEWKNKISKYTPIPPQQVPSGPVKENVFTGKDVNLQGLPNIKWHPLDFLPYIGSYAAVVMKDVETSFVNVGIYRVCAYDNQTLGMHLAIGHDGQVIRDRYWERGMATPVAICLGFDPWVADASSVDLGWGESEYDYAGWLRGKPIEVVKGESTDLPIPANAEAVIEGEIPPPSVEPLRIEGPWGEADGYYSKGFPGPVVKVKSLCYRDDPIILGCTNGSPPLRGYILPPTNRHRAAARGWLKLEKLGLPGIRGIGFAGPFMVCSVAQAYPGHVRRIIDALMGGLAGTRPPPLLLMVDDDIDPWNVQEVFWALRTRFDPVDQTTITKDVYCSIFNPRVWTPEMTQTPLERAAITSSLVLDACKPFKWKDDFSKVIGDVQPDLKQTLRTKWQEAMKW